MKTTFRIMDGVVYLKKGLYEEAQYLDNNLSKLTGSSTIHMFGRRPQIRTGIETVTIEYTYSDPITIADNPMMFLESLRRNYEKDVRGHLVLDLGDGDRKDYVINLY